MVESISNTSQKGWLLADVFQDMHESRDFRGGMRDLAATATFRDIRVAARIQPKQGKKFTFA